MNKHIFRRPVLGHSMLEMMASLAIMGVLSISVLFGWRAVMVRHHANQILDDSMILFSNVIGSELPSKVRMKPDFMTSSDKDMYGWKDEDMQGYAVQVRGISFAVCERLLRMDALIILDVTHNDIAVEKCTEDTEMTFAYLPQVPKEPEDTAVDSCDWGKVCCQNAYRFRWWGRWYCRRKWIPWWKR